MPLSLIEKVIDKLKDTRYFDILNCYKHKPLELDKWKNLVLG